MLLWISSIKGPKIKGTSLKQRKVKLVVIDIISNLLLCPIFNQLRIEPLYHLSESARKGKYFTIAPDRSSLPL